MTFFAVNKWPLWYTIFRYIEFIFPKETSLHNVGYRLGFYLACIDLEFNQQYDTDKKKVPLQYYKIIKLKNSENCRKYIPRIFYGRYRHFTDF